jgi:digeranylgeranylglycerophospholipid reductase
MSGNGILLAGDAAFQSNPMTGGGITSGMAGGKIAGQIAAQAIESNDFSADFLKRYEKEWDKVGGANQRFYYKIKEAIKELSDEQLNNTAHAVQKVPQDKQTLLKIFQVALGKQPSLLLDLVKLLSPFS